MRHRPWSRCLLRHVSPTRASMSMLARISVAIGLSRDRLNDDVYGKGTRCMIKADIRVDASGDRSGHADINKQRQAQDIFCYDDHLVDSPPTWTVETSRTTCNLNSEGKKVAPRSLAGEGCVAQVRFFVHSFGFSDSTFRCPDVFMLPLDAALVFVSSCLGTVPATRT